MVVWEGVAQDLWGMGDEVTISGQDFADAFRRIGAMAHQHDGRLRVTVEVAALAPEPRMVVDMDFHDITGDAEEEERFDREVANHVNLDDLETGRTRGDQDKRRKWMDLGEAITEMTMPHHRRHRRGLIRRILDI